MLQIRSSKRAYEKLTSSEKKKLKRVESVTKRKQKVDGRLNQGRASRLVRGISQRGVKHSQPSNSRSGHCTNAEDVTAASTRFTTEPTVKQCQLFTIVARIKISCHLPTINDIETTIGDGFDKHQRHSHGKMYS